MVVSQLALEGNYQISNDQVQPKRYSRGIRDSSALELTLCKPLVEFLALLSTLPLHALETLNQKFSLDCRTTHASPRVDHESYDQTAGDSNGISLLSTASNQEFLPFFPSAVSLYSCCFQTPTAVQFQIVRALKLL